MSRVIGAALVGVDGAAVEVEVRITAQLPRTDIVGLPEASVRESAARVRAAIGSSGQRFPDGRVTINLAPASLRKSGAGLDLAIAVGVLAAAGAIAGEALERCAFLGELALDGRLRPLRGALAMVLATRDAGCERVVVPAASSGGAALAPGIVVLAADHLTQVLEYLGGRAALAAAKPPEPPRRADATLCISDVRGQESAKRALQIAAAGGHGLLLYGPPGSGKSMLARRLPGLLPPLSEHEALAATRIHGAAGRLAEDEAIVRLRPFRAPHHSASAAGLLGGGNPPRPGEVSLAHCGVLFLDELPEFDRRVREALRQVIEDRSVTLSRASFSCCFPADFMLVCAANPCPCGWYRSEQRDCRCDPVTVERYRNRVSGPLLDRIDLHAGVPAVPWKDLESPVRGERSDALRLQVEAARELQHRRGVANNASIADAQLDALVAASAEARRLLGRAVDRLRLSARAAMRVLRVARTVADLAAEERVEAHAVAEALSYRTEGDADL